MIPFREHPLSGHVRISFGFFHTRIFQLCRISAFSCIKPSRKAKHFCTVGRSRYESVGSPSFLKPGEPTSPPFFVSFLGLSPLSHRFRPIPLPLSAQDLKFFQSEVHRAIQSQSFRTLTFGPTGPSLYAVNEHYIKPVTAAAGHMSWALMMNPGGLDCDLFITHAWQEDVFEFTEKVLASWPWRARHAWCCMLAIPQHLDIAALLRTPSSSPFAFALQSSKYMLVVPNRYTSVYTRLWCGYEAYLAFQSNKVIRTATPPVLRQVLCAWFRMLPALLIGIVVGLVTRMDQFRSALKLVTWLGGSGDFSFSLYG